MNIQEVKGEFYKKVYETVKKIPAGRVSTYSAVAHVLDSRAYRAVGTAMNKNPFAPVVPCHRVVNVDGSVGGFGSGTDNKIKMLRKEGIEIKNGKIMDFDKVLFKFD